MDAWFGFFTIKKSWRVSGISIFRRFLALFCNFPKCSGLRCCSKDFQANDKGRNPNLAQITTFRKIVKKVRKIDEISKCQIHVNFFLLWKPRINHPFPPIPELKIEFGWPIFARRPLHGPQSDPWIMKHLLQEIDFRAGSSIKQWIYKKIVPKQRLL